MKASVLLVISGSIAAVKAPELIRQLRAKNIGVRCIVTASGEKFVSVDEIEKLSGHPVSTNLFAEEEMRDMWHIRLSREVDLVVVAPASADLIAKMAQGIAGDMATATLLASDKKLIVAPAMNTYMWVHPATQRNVAQIVADGAEIIEPREGLLACGEVGAGRMAEPADIVEVIIRRLESRQVLHGLRALVTAGPTHEAIDPVRFISNHSSGKQGYAIAKALAEHGAHVTLISGPVNLAAPYNVKCVNVTSAGEMLAACEKALPADIAVCAAAVADWHVKKSKKKIKKQSGKKISLSLVENPDILHHISHHKKRPKLVIGFAAETENLKKNASKKLKRKGCDWLIANDVSNGKAFGAEDNEVLFVSDAKTERWPRMRKDKIAERLIAKIAAHTMHTGKGKKYGKT